ncbi:unnamed protein product [[Candida] boidinii]|uniref:Unnamed protein product n=1 Tax=Candida boidinii TaxID=5477 RepID=A0A9W6WIP8_CANBO|nr:hypothetical protein B5S30_g2407 [[Candida] boidinii]GME75207.1 unnamed protein product [[Candida] boidinii]GMF99798.1 unnamed protein product [[Candida] boidinii]
MAQIDTPQPQWRVNIKNPEWYYFGLELKLINNKGVLLNLNDDDDFINSIKLDLISWKKLILNSLISMNGILGESLKFDILEIENFKSIIRINNFDKSLFIQSLQSFNFNLSDIISDSFNSDSDSNTSTVGSIIIGSKSQYLTGVATYL